MHGQQRKFVLFLGENKVSHGDNYGSRPIKEIRLCEGRETCQLDGRHIAGGGGESKREAIH